MNYEDMKPEERAHADGNAHACDLANAKQALLKSAQDMGVAVFNEVDPLDLDDYLFHNSRLLQGLCDGTTLHVTGHVPQAVSNAGMAREWLATLIHTVLLLKTGRRVRGKWSV